MVHLVHFYWLPANLLQLRTLLSLITGTKAREATNQLNPWLTVRHTAVFRLQRSLLVRPWWTCLVPTLNEWESHFFPLCWGLRAVRLNWKDRTVSLRGNHSPHAFTCLHFLLSPFPAEQEDYAHREITVVPINTKLTCLNLLTCTC